MNWFKQLFSGIKIDLIDEEDENLEFLSHELFENNDFEKDEDFDQKSNGGA